MIETFAIPTVGAIIEKNISGKKHILIQERNKKNDGIETGMTEIPAGKIREYENIFEGLRREVLEETGLKITCIKGENHQIISENSGYKTISFVPFCSTQNISGGYSIILQTFLCEAEGELVLETDETKHIRLEPIEKVEEMLETSPEIFYPMHINALKKYFGLQKENK